MKNREERIQLEINRILIQRIRDRKRTNSDYTPFTWRFAVARRFIRRFCKTPEAYEKVMSEGYEEGFLSAKAAVNGSLDAGTAKCAKCKKGGLLYRSYVNRKMNVVVEFHECLHCGHVERLS